MEKTVMVIDDHVAIRTGLRTLLEGTNLRIQAEANHLVEATEMLEQALPDVILLDIRLPDTDGLKALGKLKAEYPDLPIILYSAFDNLTYVARGVALGASGFVLKSASREKLITALQAAANGEPAWTREELRMVTGPLAIRRSEQNIDIPLTHRESEVMRQMANGLTNKEIAKMLSISYETVKEHVQHILRKLGVKDRTQAAVWAVKQDYL